MKRNGIQKLIEQVKSLNARLTKAVSLRETVSTCNAPHIPYANGKGGMDFYMESYLGNDEDRFPGVSPVKHKDGRPFTKQDKEELLKKHTHVPSSNPFYGIKDGKVYQFNPKLGELGAIEVCEVGGVIPYGDELPNGWEKYAKEI
jgi:hypothetical protein